MKVDYNPTVAEQYQDKNDVAEGSGSFEQPIGSVPIKVIGTGGKVRHSGTFSTTNPYAAQIAEASNNKDRDALYERAIGWEADRANLIEQREYDDPSSQIARQRAAGINPDISGSGGSSGSSSGSSAVQPQTQGLSQFSNVSSNIADGVSIAQTVFEGINTVVGGLNVFTSAMNGINAFREAKKTFQSRKEVIDNQATITGVQADIAEGTKDSTIESTNAMNGINVANSLFSQAVDIASMFTPEMSEDEKLSLCKSIGYNDEQAGKLVSAVSTLNKTPQFQDLHNRRQMLLNESEGQKGHYTTKYFSDMSGFNVQFNLDVAEMNAHTAKFTKLVNSLVQTDSNAHNIAEADKLSNANNLERNRILRDELKSVISSIDKKLSYRATLVDKLTKEKASLIARYAKTGNALYDKFLPDMPPEVEARIDAIEQQISTIETRSNADLDSLYQVAAQFASTRYLSTQTTNSLGGATSTIGNAKYDYQDAVIFGRYRNQSSKDGGEVALDLAGSILRLIF